MSKFTMVMRCGSEGMSAESMSYTLISENYEIFRMSGEEIINALLSKKIEITNLGLEGRKLGSTNGALKNYTLIDPYGNVSNGVRAVILNRIEVNGNLAGYTIYNTNGILQEIDVHTAAEMARGNLIANGKIRHTQSGDIVASINGNYPLRVIEIAKAVREETLKAQILFMGSAITKGKTFKYGGIIIEGNSAATMTKYYEKLVKVNRNLIKEIEENTGIDESTSLKIRVTGNAGFYGVYPMDIIFELIGKAKNTIGMPMGKIMVACLDYTDDKTESSVEITKSRTFTNSCHGNSRTDKEIKEYAKKIIEKMQACTIS